MSTITDWLMVIITFVYVVATCSICWANIKSANAAKAQLEEMRKQYIDENRPYITVEVIYEKRCFYGLRLTNHGKRIANHVQIDLGQAFLDGLTETSFKEMLEKQKGKECIIGIGQHYDLFIGSNEYRKKEDKQPINGWISFSDGVNRYKEPLYIDFKNYATFFSVTTEGEELVTALKEQTKEIREIKATLAQIK
ncbi:MAG: hypothetical protein J6K48_13685 [Lachnospiraceae bacterium]|nr:hypothetical protein [Lachnospiraceae bacterium]